MGYKKIFLWSRRSISHEAPTISTIQQVYQAPTAHVHEHKVTAVPAHKGAHSTKLQTLSLAGSLTLLFPPEILTRIEYELSQFIDRPYLAIFFRRYAWDPSHRAKKATGETRHWCCIASAFGGCYRNSRPSCSATTLTVLT